MNLDTPTLQALTTVAGAAVVVAIVVQVILTAWKPTPDQRDRFGPLLAVVVGVIVVLVATFGLGTANGQTIAQGIFTGIVAGASAMGIHDLVDAATSGVSSP